MRRIGTVGVAALLFSVVSPVLAADEPGPEEIISPDVTQEAGTAAEPWKYGAILGLNLSQSAFSNNWAGGDQGSINWVVKSDLNAERQMSRRFHWANTLQLAYGQTAKQQTTASGKKEWDAPDKTTDLIQLESLGRITLDSWADPYFGLRLDSQFLDESDPIGTLKFNPVRLKESLGLARVFDKAEGRELISRLGLGLRQNFARQFTDATGDNTESFTTNDGGFEWQTDAVYPLADNRIQYKGQLLVFLPVFYSQKSDLEDFDARTGLEVADYWKTPDVNFQNTFDAKVTEWLSVNLYLQWVYDKFDAATDVDLSITDDAALIQQVTSGIRKSGQFKQTLALALSYRFL